ncbi:hypothetical protein [Pseudovibrio denitrificans]|uniref:hypothetical protein n=1 Tax=Pseudovibrio denitrificans TaxID=258256 RepID=UPI000A59A01E|nr:hypothetical protein [Pseudovibrio denitrificans]
MANTLAAPLIDDGLAKRNALLLALAQSFAGGVPPIIFATTSILASVLLVDDKSLATLPVTAFVLGTAIGTLPAGMIMRSFGRVPGWLEPCCLAYFVLCWPLMLLTSAALYCCASPLWAVGL